MNNITLDTYPDQFTSFDEFIESDDYDNTQRLFTVPLAWLADYVINIWHMVLDDFFKNCTWDDTWQLYEMAKAEGVLVSERIVKRGQDNV